MRRPDREGLNRAYRLKALEHGKSPQTFWKKFAGCKIASHQAKLRAHPAREDTSVSPPQTSCEQSTRADETRWFVDEVHTHDIALKRYLRSSFPALHDVEDIAQESYLRIWKQ